MPAKTKKSGIKLKLDTLTPQDYEKLSKPFVPAMYSYSKTVCEHFLLAV